jgi:hypothetical protein
MIWLLMLAGYVPLRLYVNTKIEFGSHSLPERAEKTRKFTIMPGKVELGLLLLAAYFFVYMLIFHRDDLSPN